MYSLILEDKKGHTLDLTKNKAYSVLEIQGLNPPPSKINMSETATSDGGKYNSSKLNMRTINIQFCINFDAEENRSRLYQVIHSKQWIKIYYKNGIYDAYETGYVESFDIDIFSQKQLVTLSILCDNPYWRKDKTVSPYSENLNVQNDGQVSCGFTCTITLKTGLNTLKLTKGNESFELNAKNNAFSYEMKSGDIITIHTERNNKNSKLESGSEDLRITVDLYHNIVQGSDWIQLDTGENIVKIEATDTSGHTLTQAEVVSKLDVEFTYSQLYEGV